LDPLQITFEQRLVEELVFPAQHDQRPGGGLLRGQALEQAITIDRLCADHFDREDSGPRRWQSTPSDTADARQARAQEPRPRSPAPSTSGATASEVTASEVTVAVILAAVPSARRGQCLRGHGAARSP